MLTVSRESTIFTNPLKDFRIEMSDEDSEDEQSKFIQRIFEFVQIENGIEMSDESSSLSDESDSDGNVQSRRPNQSLPGKRRRSDDEHNSDVRVLHDPQTDKHESVAGGNIKLKRFVDVTGAEIYSVETPVTCTEESKVAQPNVPRRKPGPLRRRLKLMCKLNLDNIDVSAVSERKNARNSTPGGDFAGLSVNVNLPEETDDENYLLDEDKILDMFQGGGIVDVSSEENSRQDEMSALRRDICRTEDSLTLIKRKAQEIQGARSMSLKGLVSNSSGNSRSLSASCSPSVEEEKPKPVDGLSKQSTIPVFQEKNSKSQNCLPKKTFREDSTARPDKSDFVPQKSNAFKPSISPKNTPEKKTQSENGTTNRKKLLKGPKSRQNLTSSEKKSCSGNSKPDAVQKPKKSFFNVEKYVQKSPKSLNRIPLTQEAILARSQMSSNRLSLSAAKKLPPKDAMKNANTAENDKTEKPVHKEAVEKSSQSSQEPFLSPKNVKLFNRPPSINCKSNENILPLSSKLSVPSSRENSTPVSPKKSNSKSSCCPSKKLTTKDENITTRDCNNDSQNKLFSRPVRFERRDNVPNRDINQGNGVSSPLSDFATRRDISTPHGQSPQEKLQKDSRSEQSLAKLGLPNCEEPVCINWNHSNIPSVVNPEGMSLCKNLLSFYRKDLGVNEAIVCQLGKLDPLVLSQASKSSASPESPLSKRLSDIQIPSRKLSKDVLSEIDTALNAD